MNQGAVVVWLNPSYMSQRDTWLFIFPPYTEMTNCKSIRYSMISSSVWKVCTLYNVTVSFISEFTMGWVGLWQKCVWLTKTAGDTLSQYTQENTTHTKDTFRPWNLICKPVSYIWGHMNARCGSVIGWATVWQTNFNQILRMYKKVLDQWEYSVSKLPQNGSEIQNCYKCWVCMTANTRSHFMYQYSL